MGASAANVVTGIALWREMRTIFLLLLSLGAVCVSWGTIVLLTPPLGEGGAFLTLGAVWTGVAFTIRYRLKEAVKNELSSLNLPGKTGF